LGDNVNALPLVRTPNSICLFAAILFATNARLAAWNIILGVCSIESSIRKRIDTETKFRVPCCGLSTTVFFAAFLRGTLVYRSIGRTEDGSGSGDQQREKSPPETHNDETEARKMRCESAMTVK
jgi:hypothetical protein